MGIDASSAAPRFAALTTCYHRWEYLRRALPTWHALHGLQRILIGYLGADPPTAAVAGAELVHVAASDFHITRLRNCVAQQVRDDDSITHLLFIDSDILVKDPQVFTLPPDVDALLDSPFAVVMRPEEAVRAGDPERADGARDRGKRGTHLVRKDLFFALNGYDQRLNGWAGDDVNLYHRYARHGGRIGFYDRDGIAHIAHGDQERARENPVGESAADSLARNHAITFGEPDLYGQTWRDSFGYSP